MIVLIGFTGNGKTPNGTQSTQVLNGTTITLTSDGNSGAFVQVRKDGGAYTDDTIVAVYTVDGTTPAPGTGFNLGDGDYRYFDQGELENGVKFETGEAAIVGEIIIQYYNN